MYGLAYMKAVDVRAPVNQRFRGVARRGAFAAWRDGDLHERAFEFRVQGPLMRRPTDHKLSAISLMERGVVPTEGEARRGGGATKD